MVLRHGPQLNEQLHKIIGQPQVVKPTTNDLNLDDNTFLISSLERDLGGEPLEGTSSQLLISNQYLSPSNFNNLNLETSSNKASDNTITVDLSPKLEPTKKFLIEIEFEICLAGIELNARLLSTLKARYTLRKAICNGNRYVF